MMTHKDSHAAEHKNGGLQELKVEELATVGAAGDLPVAQSDGSLVMQDDYNAGKVTLKDQAADPGSANVLQLNKEELKLLVEGAVQKLVMQRYPGANPGLNQLRNPSFEVDPDGTNPPTGWVKGTDGGEVDDTDKYDGAKSVLVPAAAAANSTLRQDIAIKKGQYIRASLACKATTANHGGLYVGGVAEGALLNIKHTGGGGWELLRGVYGPFTQNDTLRFYLYKFTATATDIWFDQAVLEVFDAPVYPIDYLQFRDVGVPGTSYRLQRDGADLKFHDGTMARTLLQRFVVRNATAADFTIGAPFVTDGVWHVDGLDLSAIVPAGAVAVDLLIEVNDDAVSYFYLRRDATNALNRLNAQVSVSANPNDWFGRIAVNADRLLDYWATNTTWTSISVTVLGWVVPG